MREGGGMGRGEEEKRDKGGKGGVDGIKQEEMIRE